MDNWMYDWLPVAIAIVLGLCVLWAVLRIVRALFRRPVRHEPDMAVTPVNVTRQEPRIVPAAASQAAIPDAADVLALKQSIDNLARQIAILERRLAGSESVRTSVESSRPEVQAAPPTTSAAPPVILPERRG